MTEAARLEPETGTFHAVPHSRCFVCGRENARGLQTPYTLCPDGATEASWTPTASCEGFQGIIHGGIVATVLDEAMSKAVAATGCEALTGESSGCGTGTTWPPARPCTSEGGS